MDPMIVALVGGAVLGAMKGKENEKAYKQAQKVEATREKWAPFTGRRGQTVTKPSATDPLMQGLVAGAMLGQQFDGGGAQAPGQAPVAGQPAAPSGVSPEGIPMASAQPWGPQANYYAPYRGGKV